MLEQFCFEEAEQTPIPDDSKAIKVLKKSSTDNCKRPVAIGPFSEHRQLLTNALYFDFQAFLESEYFQPKDLRMFPLTPYLFKEAANLLVKAQGLLPPTYRLLVLDGYNPLSTICPRSIPHLSGEAVDVTLINLSSINGQRLIEIDKISRNQTDPVTEKDWLLEAERSAIMIDSHQLCFGYGSPLDPRKEDAALCYYESLPTPLGEDGELNEDEEQDIQRNRRILYHLMKSVGFQACPERWWHYQL